MSEFTVAIQKMFKANDDIRDAGLTTPKTIFRYGDIIYGKDENYQSLDVYTPLNKKDEKLPVIISVHGGGWVYGDKERYQYYAMNLAERGFKVVNFTYRLAPDYKYPAQIQDINLVLNWMKENQKIYNFDLNNLFAVGDSAGATLLGVYAGIVSKPELGKPLGIKPPEKIKFKAIALNHGCYDLSTPTGIGDMADLNTNIMKELFENKGTLEELETIAVTNFISKDYPAVYIISSNDDFLRNEPSKLIQVLTENLLSFVYHFFGTPDKKLSHVFHLDIKSEDAKIANDEECNFFKTFC